MPIVNTICGARNNNGNKFVNIICEDRTRNVECKIYGAFWNGSQLWWSNLCVCVCAGSEVEFLMRHWRQSHKTCLKFCEIATFRVEKDLQFVHRWFWVCCCCCSRDLSVERAMPCHFIMWIQQQENYLMRQIRSSLSRRLMLSWQFYSIEWYEASNFQLRESIQCHEDAGSWSVLGFVEIITNHECICVWKQRRQ